MNKTWQVEFIPERNPIKVDFKEIIAHELEIASPDILGGVRPQAKTEEMTQPVGIDAVGMLWTKNSIQKQADWNQLDENAVDFIKNKPSFNLDSLILTEDALLEMLIDEDMLVAVVDFDGAYLADENGNILLW